MDWIFDTTWHLEWLSELPLIARVLIATSLTYFFVILLMRISGKRTVARMNSFDWILNVAMGSLAASAILTPEDLPASLLGMATMVGLQWLLTRLTFRYPAFSKWIKEEPALVVSNGVMDRRAMSRARINEDEIMGEVRKAGLTSIDRVGAMTFEPSGAVSVIESEDGLPRSDIPRADENDGFTMHGRDAT
ncbi:MAG: YetF domain-containing protein [Litorimonas sp.]